MFCLFLCKVDFCNIKIWAETINFIWCFELIHFGNQLSYAYANNTILHRLTTRLKYVHHIINYVILHSSKQSYIFLLVKVQRKKSKGGGKCSLTYRIIKKLKHKTYTNKYCILWVYEVECEVSFIFLCLPIFPVIWSLYNKICIF